MAAKKTAQAFSAGAGGLGDRPATGPEWRADRRVAHGPLGPGGARIYRGSGSRVSRKSGIHPGAKDRSSSPTPPDEK